MISNRGAINPVAFAAEAVLVTSPVRNYMTTTPPEKHLLPVGTKVKGPHGKGEIIGYNTSSSSFYGADRYPYVCHFEDGYEDVYDCEMDVKILDGLE